MYWDKNFAKFNFINRTGYLPGGCRWSSALLCTYAHVLTIARMYQNFHCAKNSWKKFPRIRYKNFFTIQHVKAFHSIDPMLGAIPNHVSWEMSRQSKGATFEHEQRTLARPPSTRTHTHGEIAAVELIYMYKYCIIHGSSTDIQMTLWWHYVI